jgi:16S rRNA A1518/A1519 N6-dimethyltransferase RsmA/KsgA/DIM1 with predicted DNA glycosylase/AP lyase activity
MNRLHGLICSSSWWARSVERELLPWGLAGVDLGEEVLEIGPGFGATTSVLARHPGSLTVLELSQSYCSHLRAKLAKDVEIVQADAARVVRSSCCTCATRSFP